jgi:DNA-binding SARP family transcriptional activator/tetratricopeptide (TPR) repeat protein
MLRDSRFRLVTLGRLTLIGAAGEEDISLAKRRFKLALLSVLAMARRPLSRDALLEMFWGDHDESRARHSLSNALSSLRRALGQRAITTRDADVALASDLPLDVDALELADAVEEKDFARVVELYGGPFLDGVHIDDSPAFDQWVSRERRRLEALFLQACAHQCATLARGRRWEECHAVAARWIDIQPLSADAALFLLNATKGPGTRVALGKALEEYEQLRVRLAREFDLVPEPVVVELVERIREQIATAPPAPNEVVTPPAPVAVVATPDAPVSVATPTTPQPSLPVPPPRRAKWTVAAFVAAGVVLGALAFAMAKRRTAGADAAANAARRPLIVVVPMRMRSTDSTLGWLADGLPQMIAGKLARNRDVDVVPAAQVRAVLERSGNLDRSRTTDAVGRDAARRVGASLVALGTLGRDNGKLVLDLTIHSVKSGELVRNAVLSNENALSLADEAAVRILDAANVSAEGSRLVEIETSSLEAYQHYMRAVEAAIAGHNTESTRELDAAIALDSGFITAVRERLGGAISAEDTAMMRRLRETMRKYAHRASEFDRMYQEAIDAFSAGERDRSEALAAAIVRRYPRDPRALQVLEIVLGGHGQFDESERVVRAAIAMDSLAMEAGTGPCAPCHHLYSMVNLYWMRGDWAGAAEWARRWIRLQPDAPSSWHALAWTYSYMQRPDSGLPLLQRAMSLAGGEGWAIEQYARMLIVSRRYAQADSTIASMESSSSPENREAAYDLRSLLQREHGNYRAANRTMDRYAAEFPGSLGLSEMIRADNDRMLGNYAQAFRWYHETGHPGPALPMPIPSGSARGFCWRHALAADAYSPTGDTVTLKFLADTLEHGCVRSFYFRDWALFHHVRGLVALQAGRYDEAERELKQAVFVRVEPWTRTIVALAQAQSALGRPRDAIATLRIGYATRLDAMSRYVPISVLDFWAAKLFAQAGQADSARVYAGYVRSAWRNADPEIKQQLAQLP